MPLCLLNHAEQVAAYLRSEILRGRWVEEMPGADHIGLELNVNHTTVGAAIQLLEKEGLLVNRGAGRRRQIVIPDGIEPPSLRVGLLLYERAEERVDYIVGLKHRLLETGHSVVIPSKTLLDIRMDVARVEKLVNKTKADAWIIQAGSEAVLQWFAKRSTPAFALAGRRRGVQISGSGPNKLPAMQTAVRKLVALGHRRIVMLSREERRKPAPGLIEKSFLKELTAQGISVGKYNLPDWEDSHSEFYACIDSLFRHTPPTALIIGEAQLFLAAERHLSRLGYQAPDDVSLVCMDPSTAFDWFQPKVTHIHWDSRSMINRIIKWADNVSRGKIDRRQSFTKAEFIEGGTIGPAPNKA